MGGLARIRQSPGPEEPGEDIARLWATVTKQQARIETLEQEVRDLTAALFSPPPGDDPVQDIVNTLAFACAERGFMVSGDGFVLERDAAALLNRSPFTLRNWRDQHRPLPFRKIGTRVEYSLNDLAAYFLTEPN